MIRVLICDSIHEEAIKRLKTLRIEVGYKPDISYEKLLDKVETCDALIVRGRTKVTSEVIRRGSSLKLIVRAGVGLDNIDVDAARIRGVKVVNTPEAPTNAVAELALGLMISLARKISFCDSQMKTGKWVKRMAMGFEISGKNLGLLGFGRIGRCLAEKALCLGMKVIAYDIIGIPEEYLKKGVIKANEVEEVFEKSDFISIHVPLTSKTYHMVDEKLISRMKKTAYLINTSRGAVVDSKALKKALKQGLIAGAALDVFEVEPPGKDELVLMENVIVTPHIGAQTLEAQKLAAIMAANRVIEFFKESGKLI